MKTVVINSQVARLEVLSIRKISKIINIELQAILDDVEALRTLRHQLLIQVGRNLAHLTSTGSKQALVLQQVTAKKLQLTSAIAANA